MGAVQSRSQAPPQEKRIVKARHSLRIRGFRSKFYGYY
jgi:hypothetical protein